MPVPAAPLIPVAVAVAASSPWWALPVLAFFTAIALMYLTEFAKSKFGASRTESDLMVARETMEGARRDDSRELLSTVANQYTKVSEQYASILQAYQVVIVQNAENSATVRTQTGEITRLRDDIKVIQAENALLKGRLERLSGTEVEIAHLKERILILENQLADKNAEIARLLLLNQQAETKATEAFRLAETKAADAFRVSESKAAELYRQGPIRNE